MRVTSVLVDPGSFGASYSVDNVISELSINHIPNFLVRKGDDLSVALGNTRRR